MDGNALHKLVLFFLAFGMFAGTLFIEGRMPVEASMVIEKDVFLLASSESPVQFHGAAQSGVIEQRRELVAGDSVTSQSGQVVQIQFDGNGMLRLAPDSELTLVKKNGEGVVFRLQKGKVWVHNQYATSALNIIAGGALMIPKRAVFDVELRSTSEQIRVFESHVVVGLVPLNYTVNEILASANGPLINSFLVAKGSQTVVYNDKIEKNAQALANLLYSKLIKEFLFSLMDQQALLSDQWVQNNLDMDKALRVKALDERSNAVSSKGLRYTSLEGIGYQMDASLSQAADFLTFFDEKKRQRRVDMIFDHISDAQYFFLFGRNAEAGERIQLFKDLIAQEFRTGDTEYKEYLLRRLRNVYVSLNVVLPGEPLFGIKMALSDVLLTNLGSSESALVEKIDLLRDYVHYASALAESNVAFARLAMQQYFERFQNFMRQHRSQLGPVKFLILQENQIMDNLLRQYPQFYQENFFAIKHSLETEWLSLLPEGNDKIEERQTIIFTKIDFLKQLQQFFLDEKIALEDASKITLRLITEVKELQTVGQIGVNQLFALRLKDYGNFLVFLDSVTLSEIRSSSARVKFQEFQARQKEEISVERALNVVLGNEIFEQSEVTVEDIIAGVQSDLAKLEADNVRLGDFTDVDNQQFIEVLQARLDDVVFSARYDWDKKLFFDVRAGGILVAEGPVRLGALPTLLAPKQTQLPASRTPTAQTPDLTRAEKAVLSLLIQKLLANNITASLENIVIRDIDEGVFVVNGARLKGVNKVQIAFLYKSKADEVSSLIVRTATGDEKILEALSLADVSTLAEQVYKRNEE